MSKILTVACLVLFATPLAPAGETEPLEPLTVGELVKVNDNEATGKIICFLQANKGGARLTVFVYEVPEELRRKLSAALEVHCRKQKGKDDKMLPVPEERAVLKRLAPGEKIEIHYFRAGKKNLPTVAAVKVLRAFPREGTMTGVLVNKEEERFKVKLTRPPIEGTEDMVGKAVQFSARLTRNPNTKDRAHAWIPDPKQVELFATLPEGHLVEIPFKTDSRFRMDEFKDLGEAPENKPAEGEGKKEGEPKKAPRKERKKKKEGEGEVEPEPL